MVKRSASHAYGFVRDLLDHRDFKMKLTLNRTTLPRKVDLRTKMPMIYDQGDLGSCHDEKTEVLTKKGWKFFVDVSMEDELASVDPETKKLIFEHPIRLIQKEFQGEMICADNRSLNFCVTPDHMMIVRKWNEKLRTLSDNCETIMAKDLGWYSGLINRIIWEGEYKETYTLSGVSHKTCPEQREDIFVPLWLWLRFIGIYVAEGTLSKEDPQHYKIQLAASKDREKTFIRETLSSLHIHYLELEDRFTFDNKRIYKSLEYLGFRDVKAPNKFVPSFIFSLCPKLIEEFLLGHFMGDGCEQNGLRSHYTSAKKLADDIQYLILLTGNETRISVREPRTAIMKDGREVRGNYPEYRVSVCEKKNLSLERKEQIFTKPYNGDVFCAEVPTYHTLVTRREGKILISGNCTANAVGALVQYERALLKHKPDFIPSRLFIYYNERVLEDTVSWDSGATIRDSIKAVAQWGECPETEWVYDISKFDTRPTDQCFTDALKYKTLKYERVTQSLTQLKTALSLGKPITFGFTVYESFESSTVTRTGVVPLPKRTEMVLGGHAVVLVGYDDGIQRFIVRNSWGTNWGMVGYFTMPYSYVTNVNLASDFWAITATLA